MFILWLLGNVTKHNHKMCAKTSPKRGIFALLPFPLKALALVIFDQIAPQISNILSGKKAKGTKRTQVVHTLTAR